MFFTSWILRQLKSWRTVSFKIGLLLTTSLIFLALKKLLQCYQPNLLFYFFRKPSVSTQFNVKQFIQKNKRKPGLSLSLALCNLQSLSLSLSLSLSSLRLQSQESSSSSRSLSLSSLIAASHTVSHESNLSLSLSLSS